jgi:hypothetical protein
VSFFRDPPPFGLSREVGLVRGSQHAVQLVHD